jgi:hypothetical protein
MVALECVGKERAISFDTFGGLPCGWHLHIAGGWRRLGPCLPSAYHRATERHRDVEPIIRPRAIRLGNTGAKTGLYPRDARQYETPPS